MRLVQVAKILGMSGQQLRKELTEVNFGVKPTDREVPLNLANGIVRFIANKHGLKIDLENLDLEGLQNADALEEKKQQEGGEEQPTEETEEAPAEKAAPKLPPQNLNVLRKLTLDGVSKEAIEKQKEQLAKTKPQSRPEGSGRNRVGFG